MGIQLLDSRRFTFTATWFYFSRCFLSFWLTHSLHNSAIIWVDTLLLRFILINLLIIISIKVQFFSKSLLFLFIFYFCLSECNRLEYGFCLLCFRSTALIAYILLGVLAEAGGVCLHILGFLLFFYLWRVLCRFLALRSSTCDLLLFNFFFAIIFFSTIDVVNVFNESLTVISTLICSHFASWASSLHFLRSFFF